MASACALAIFSGIKVFIRDSEKPAGFSESLFHGEKGYKAISYNILNNTEQLHKMEIGHDTVLKYGLEMIKEYDLLKRVIIDRYPYILIDEYQYTSTPVI